MKQTIKYLVFTIVIVLSIVYLKLSLIRPPLEVAMSVFREDEQSIKNLEKYIRENYMDNKSYYAESRIIFTKSGGISHPYMPHIKDPVLANFYSEHPQIKQVRLERGLCDEKSKFSEIIFLLECEFAGNVSIENDDCMKSDFINLKNNRVELVKVDDNWKVSVEYRW